MKTIQITISGKVQGVYFRASAKEEADKLGIRGTVQNITNGNVFIEAEGEEGQLNRFIEWCQNGPDRAVVKEVQVEETELQNFRSFVVRR